MTTRNLVTAIKRDPLSQIVADEIGRLILSGDIEPGSKLPSEHALARQFEVSRNVVREGLRRLSAQGLVSVRAGDGIYVCRPDEGTVLRAISGYLVLNRTEHWIDDLFELRRVLEVELAVLAAQRATPEDVQSLEAALAKMRANMDVAHDWAEADIEFHDALCRASHNSLAPLVLDPLLAQLRPVFEGEWGSRAQCELGLGTHAPIIDHLRNHDPEAMRATMLRLLRVNYSEIKELQRAHPYLHERAGEVAAL